ncbi:MAG: FAD-dependent oxidoreductase [Pseudomonadota bacterium]
MSPVVIAGSGLAGYTLARELRKLAPDLPITLITADSGDLYSKPMLSNALAQGHTPQGLVQSSAAEQAEKLNIQVRSHCPITALHPAEHRLDTGQGPMEYGRLALALGARPSHPGFPGAELALSVNHLDDYARFRDRLAPGARVAILGGGLVGCEFANDLALAGHPVELVELADRPLARQAPPALSRRLQVKLEALGVAWHCGRRVTGLMVQGEGYRLSLDDGRELAADLVLSAIGLTPATELARAAGLEVGRGIRVDESLATSAAAIHALGDCAEVVPQGGTARPGLLLPYVLPLMQQARVLASILAGNPARLSLPALPVAVKTPACPMVVCPPPDSTNGRWHTERDDEAGAIHHFLAGDGSLLGFALAGDACTQRRTLAGRVPALLV